MPRRPTIPLAVAALGVLGLALDWVLAFRVPATMRIDKQILEGFGGLYRGPIATLADVVPHLSDPQPFTLGAIVVVAVALGRGRPKLALAAAAVLVGANVTTQWLKPLLSEPRVVPEDASLRTSLWPSGHATASMSLCLAAVLVAPARWRPLLAALGAGYSLAVTFTLLVDVWHFPSDVVAGYLMAGTWTALAVAAMWASEGRARVGARAARSGPGLVRAVRPAVLVAAAGIGLVVLVAALRPDAVADYVREHTTFVVGATLIAALALGLAAALSTAMAATRRRDSRPG